jgi:threonylcarbamoyladenosine tRNA methylthiotransferase MtaB
MGSFSIRNFGCRVNQAESFEWSAALQKRGLRFEPDAERGEFVILNSCTLTARADRDARKFIRHILRTNPRARIVVTGCLAERNPEEFGKLSGVWKVIPNVEKNTLPDRLVPGVKAAESGDVLPFRSRALLKVQDGCNMACAFCIIPRVRGQSASVARAEAIDRLGRLTGQGFKEIVLTGIHLCSYGHDLSPKSSLLDLLRDIERIPGEFRIRLSSLDPRLLAEPLAEHLATSQKVCPHFHLSLQHGSERILKAMGRASTPAGYRAILDVLRRKSPCAALGADIIVGFPGESDEDFRDMEAFLEQSPLTYFHVFSYSARPGTAAASLPAVAETRKRARATRLRQMSRRKNIVFRRSFEDTILPGIVIQKKGSAAEVLTTNYLNVRVPLCAAAEGAEVRVKIARAGECETLGDVVR